MMKKVLMNWSGGKDSSLCLFELLKSEEYEVVGLFTSLNEEFGRVSMHGVRKSLIEKQAESIGIPLHFFRIPEKVTINQYNRLMQDALCPFLNEGIEYCAFGDIFLEDLRAHREEKLSKVNMKALFPLWKKSTKKLACQFIDDGFRAILAAINGSKLGKQFAGQRYDRKLLKDLADDVDPCGEYGEFHSFVYDGPFFKTPVSFKKGEVVERVYQPPQSGSSGDSFSHNPDQESTSVWFVDLYE